MEGEILNSVNLSFLKSFERDIEKSKWSSSRKQRPTIYRVSRSIRNVDPKSYDPKLISIGPFHHGKPGLEAMEIVKLSYLNQFLSRNREMSLEKYTKEMKEMEDHVRGAYWGKVDLESDKFVRMMLLDGCFIVEFLLQWFLDPERDHEAPTKWEDPIRGLKMTRNEIIGDLLLLENQLPFFLLEKILRFVYPNGNLASLMKLPLFIYCADLILYPNHEAFEDKYIIEILESSSSHNTSNNIHHFLHLCHDSIVNDELRNITKKNDQAQDHTGSNGSFRIFVDKTDNSNELLSILSGKGSALANNRELHIKLETLLNYITGRVKSSLDNHNRIPSAVQLNDAGVRLRRKHNARSILDVSFDRGMGVMEIPQLHIYDKTNSIFHNLIAFEQSYGLVEFHLSAYCLFLDVLVNTPADVEILQKKGILMSHLGSDKDVSVLTNRMCREVIVNIQTSYLEGMFEDVNKYCGEVVHEWMAKLNSTYFSNPWATISFVTGIFVMMVSIFSVTLAGYRFFKTQH